MLSPVRVPTLFPNDNITSLPRGAHPLQMEEPWVLLPTQLRDFPILPFKVNSVSKPIVTLPKVKESILSEQDLQEKPILSTGKTSSPSAIPSPIRSFKSTNPASNQNISLSTIEMTQSVLPIVPKSNISIPALNNQGFKPKILVQSIPRNNKTISTGRQIIPGPLYIVTGQYKSDEIITISEPNISSEVNNDAQTLRAINTVPYIERLPAFIYQRDSSSGQLTRYLATEEDNSYDTDPDYGINQEWLLFQRQGDQYNRIPEWNQYPEITEAEKFNMLGVTTLNEGRVWMGPPRTSQIPRSEYYDEYKRYIEYGQTQIEEEADE